MLKLEELEEMWLKDGKIDQTQMVNASADIPKLHNKYYTLYSKENLRLLKLKADMKELTLAKTTLYNGSIDEFELKKWGWEPVPLKILRTDIPQYLEADKDMIALSLRIGYCNQVVKYLEDIIKQINTRNFIIKNIIDYMRFTSGSA